MVELRDWKDQQEDWKDCRFDLSSLDCDIMKVRVVHRNPDEFDPSQRKGNTGHRMLRNADPRLHPLEKVLEQESS